jgi:hypothetical protein
MADEKIVAETRQMIAECLKTPIDELVSNPPRWGTINFEPGRPVLQRTFDILGHLNILPIELLPDSVAQQIRESIRNFLAVINEIRKFSIEQGEPQSRRQQLLSGLQGQADAVFTQTQGYIPFLAYQRGDITKNINDLSRAITDAKKLVVEAEGHVATKKTELDGIIKAAREASASVGVAHFTEDFRNEATAVQALARYWLFATILGAGLTVAIAALMIFFQPEKSDAALVSWHIPRIAIIAVLFTGTLWCGRIYKATLHQYVMNRHRANSLKTFQAFVQATPNEQIRDAVLLETTRSIFSISPSGYIDPKADGGEPSTHFLEVVRDSGKKAAA